MRKHFIVGLCSGILLVLCFGAAYEIVVSKTAYTDVIDPNDAIYAGLNINPAWFEKYGNNERTVIFFNIAVNRKLILDLMVKQGQQLVSADPNAISKKGKLK